MKQDFETSPSLANVTEVPDPLTTSSSALTASTEPDLQVIWLAGEAVPVCQSYFFCISLCGFHDNNEGSLNDRQRRSVKLSQSGRYTNGDISYAKRFPMTTETPSSIFERATEKKRDRDVNFLSIKTEVYEKTLNYPWPLRDKEKENIKVKAFGSEHWREGRRRERSSEKICMNYGKSDNLCYCDEFCVIYGDCCVDTFQNCFNIFETDLVYDFISNKRNIDTVGSAAGLLDIGLAQAITRYPWDVDKIVAIYIAELGSCYKTHMDMYFYVRLISECPRNVQDTSLRDRCDGKASPLLPLVTAVLQGRSVIFKNYFCAACHGISDTELEVWNMKLDCNITAIAQHKLPLTIASIEQFAKNGDCKTIFRLPDDSCEPRVCHIDRFIADADEKLLTSGVADGLCTPDDAMLCQTYISPREGYRNLHCKRCLHNSTADEGDINLKCETIKWDEKGRPGLILILDITGHYTAGRGLEIASYSCGETEVFDPSKHMCKRLYCSQGYEPYYGTCYQVPDVYFVDPDSQLYPDNWSELTIDFTNAGVQPSCQFIVEQLTKTNLTVNSYVVSPQKGVSIDQIPQEIVNLTNGSLQCPNKKLTITQMTVSSDSDLTVTMNELEFIALQTLSSSSPNNDRRFEVGLTPGTKSDELTCPLGGRLKNMTDFAIEKYYGAWYVTYNRTLQKIFYPVVNIRFKRVFYWEGSTFTFSDTIFVCDDNKLYNRENCSVVMYPLNQTSVNGSRLFVMASGAHYDEEDFEIVEDQVFVCSKFKAEKQVENLEEDTAYLIVSWVFSIVPILFLLAMVVCYCMFPELCNLPGKMTASLAGTMMFTFLFNLFTLVELHHEYVCPVAAALSHLVTLAHFGWMSAIAVNMALTFGPGSFSRINTLSNNKAFIRYNVVVWGSSFIIVLTSVILDIVHSDSSSEPQDHTQFADNNTDIPRTVAEAKRRLGSLASSSSSSSSSGDFPRYGYPYCTWFSGPIWSRLAFVVIPYFITFLINVVSFILTLVGIQRSSQGAVKLGKKSNDRVRCLIYVKLSTAMGFSWSLSLLTNFVEKNDVLPYIYVTLVLLQGVLLFLAFMTNKRVYGLISRRSAYLIDKTSGTTVGTSRGDNAGSSSL